MVRNLAIGLFSDIRLSITKGGISQRIIVSRRTRLQTRAVPQGRSDRPQREGPREVGFRVGQKVISTHKRTLLPKMTHEILQGLPRKTLRFTTLVPDDRSAATLAVFDASMCLDEDGNPIIPDGESTHGLVS